MGAKCTFDPITRIIQITSAPVLVDGEYVVEFDVKVDLYSDGKEDWLANEPLRRLTYPVRAVGGDPLPGSKALGATYFLDAGWKIRPYEASHVFRVNGNLYSEDGTSPFTQTTGSWNVFLEQQVSSLVDSTVQQLAEIEQASFNGGVTVDFVNGVAGTNKTIDGRLIGSPRAPSNNWADAYAIGQDRGLGVFFVVGDASIDTAAVSFAGMSFVGESPTKSTITVDTIADVDGCEFYDATILGVLDGDSKLYDCHLSNLQYVNGTVERCTLNAGTIVLAGGAKADFVDCRSGVEGWDTPVIDMGGSGQPMTMRNYNGGIKLINKTGPEAVSIDINSGQAIIDSTVTDGLIAVRGIGKVTDNSTGTAVVDQTYMLSPWSIAFYGKILTIARYLGLK